MRTFLLLLCFFSLSAFAQGQNKKITISKGTGNYLKPKSIAPPFSLQNEKGETVSLQQFKGKVVYIDFWGVDCKPCINEIKNFVPQLHEQYKDKDVAFINICVEGDEQRWKELLGVHELGGTNLYAEGWIKNPVCQAYHVSPIPHYVLIDREGKIVEGYASRPEQLDLKSGRNAIDRLLKK